MTHHTTSQEESERECMRGIARSSCVWWTGWSSNMWWIVRSECGCALDWAKNVCVGGTGGIARSACADASSFWSWPSSKHDDITTRKDRLPKHKKNMLASSQSWFFWARAFSHQAWLEPNHSNRCLHLGSANSGKACLSYSKSFLLRNRNLKFARIVKKTWPSVSTILRSLGLALLACNNPGLLTVRSLIMGRASSPSLGLFHFYELVPYQFHDKDESSE